VTYKDAAELGIDNLEHGFFVNTQFDPDKKPDECSASAGDYTLEHLDPASPEAKDLMDTLVKHHVAITSTLPVFEALVPGRPPLRQQVLEAMAPEAREAYLYNREQAATLKSPKTDWAMLLKRDMQMESAFAAAGGLLLAGPDPTGNGGVVPGFGDQREIELLVEAGFSPVQAIKIATLNGATYLGKEDQIGSIAAGKNADLVIVKGWHILDGELTFRYADRTETVGPGTTVFVPAGVAHTYTAGPDARYLIVLTPRLSALIAALQADHDPAHQHEIYQRFDSQVLE
jgi:hypothetical protein